MKDMVFILLSISVIPLVSYYIYAWISSSYSNPCNMNNAENRDFNRFYGITELGNHFTQPLADGCNSNMEFKAVFPQAVLKSDKSPSSFMVLSKYGTGKTLLRCQYYESLESNSYFKVLILNKQINEYLERFVTETSSKEKNCESIDCLEGWSKNEFAQVILSLLVTQFINVFSKEQFNLPDISLEEKVKLITIICFYYNDQGASKLENFANSFLKKTGNSMYSARNAMTQLKEQNKNVYKPLFSHYINDLKKLNVLRSDSKKLALLLSIVEGEEFQHESFENNMSEKVFSDLT